MRTELMTDAMCWDLSSKVNAEYARTYSDFSYFCPHPGCLERVHAKRRKNTYFVAERKHVQGCPNEAKEVESTGSAPKPAKKESVLPAQAIPTELGPAKLPTEKKGKPTRDELLALADSLNMQPPYCSGTLLEVVTASRGMSVEQRREKQLRIYDNEFTYQSAFFCLGIFGDNPIEDLPCATQIIYGAVRINETENCYFVKSVKAFHADENKLNLILRVQKDNAAAQHIKELLTSSQDNKSYTIFYFGDVPKLSASGKSYGINIDISDDYKRFVVLLD